MQANITTLVKYIGMVRVTKNRLLPLGERVGFLKAVLQVATVRGYPGEGGNMIQVSQRDDKIETEPSQIAMKAERVTDIRRGAEPVTEGERQTERKPS